MLQQRIVTVIPSTPQKSYERSKQGRLKVAAYCRVSTDQEEQQTSYQGQIDYYTEKINKNPEWKLAGIFADEGITGTSAKKRPEFLKMIELCQAGKIDLILTKSMSRFSRNNLECLKYVRLLKDLDIPIIFEKENINTVEMVSEMMISILGAFAQAESESISKNVAIGKRYSFKEGKVSFNYKHFLGYRKGADGNPEIDPDEAKIIKTIYTMYLNGESFDTIKAHLEANNIKTPMGKTSWSKAVIKSILSNEKYKGDALLQKTYITDCISKTIRKNNGALPQYYVQNSHPAIISPEIYDRVQEELARRTSKRNVSNKAKTNNGKYSSKFALTELLVCGDCGTKYRRVTWAKRGTKKVVWRCINRLDYGTKYCKSSPTLEESRIHRAITNAISQLHNNLSNVMHTVKQNMAVMLEQIDDIEIVEINKKIDQLNHEMVERINSDIHERKDRAALEQKCAEIAAEVESLRTVIQAKEQNNKEKSQQRTRLKDIYEVLDTTNFVITEFDDNLIRKIIDQITVLDSDKIRVTFKNGFQIEQQLPE